MKRIAAILLSCILMFNWIGYQLLTRCLQNQVNAQLEARLDNMNYDESTLISVKVAAPHLSYYANAKQYDRVDGEIDIDGIQYKFVQRRFYNDSLEYKCIPNVASMRLQKASTDFFKLVNDLQSNGQGKKEGAPRDISKIYASEYFALIDGYRICHQVAVLVSSRSAFYLTKLPHITLSGPDHPPQFHA